MKTLIIAEKPSVAQEIAAVLGAASKKDGYVEGSGHIITWAIGHLLEMYEPEDYNEKLKQWSLNTLPIIPQFFYLKPTAKGAKQLKIIKNLTIRQDIKEVVNACDAGREGELIFRRIINHTGCRKPVKRLWLRETTKEAILSAFKELKPSNTYDNLAEAATKRGVGDWLVGLNATRAFTKRHNELLTIGRVQTPTLAMIVSREHEIIRFKPQDYFQIKALFKCSSPEGSQPFSALWFRGDTDRLNTHAEAETIVKSLPTTATITDIHTETKRTGAPTLFNLADLQKEANKRFGYTAAQTLKIAQSLYEDYKLITYPRTDSKHLSTTLEMTLPSRIDGLRTIPDYAKYIPKSLPKLSKAYVDDAKISDHHAIIPTATQPNLAKLKPDEQKIYDLIARRFLAIFLPQHIVDHTTFILQCGADTFRAKGKTIVQLGWKAIYTDPQLDQENREEEEDDQQLPPLAKGQQVTHTKTDILAKQTKPAKRYTEASLITAMETAGKFTEDVALADTLKEKGIGTPATRAAIIEKLKETGYIEVKKKTIHPTQKGIRLIDLVPEELKSVELTAKWEQGLHDIEQGKANAQEWLEGIKQFTVEIVDIAKSQTVSTFANNTATRLPNGSQPRDGQPRESLGLCPICGRPVYEAPKSYSCSGYKDTTKPCSFAIWKEKAGKTITQAMAKTLLKNKRTNILKGFKSGPVSKTPGKPFEAALILTPDGKLSFEFSQHNS